MKLRRAGKRDEMLDVVNEKDEIVGKVLRSVVHQNGLLHRVVHVIIFNKNNEILLPLRSATKSVFPNTYDCSISEHVLSGEEPIKALRRGLREELDIRGKGAKLLDRYVADYSTPEYNTLSYLYELRFGGRVRVDPKEVSRAEYLPAAKILHMLREKDVQFAPWTRELLRAFFGLPNKLKKVR